MSLIPKLQLWFSSINKAIAIRRIKPGPDGSGLLPTSTIPSTIPHLDPPSDIDDHTVSANAASINHIHHENATSQKILEHAITALTVLSPAVGVVPIAGTPLKSAFGALLEALNIVDVSVGNHIFIQHDNIEEVGLLENWSEQRGSR